MNGVRFNRWIVALLIIANNICWGQSAPQGVSHNAALIFQSCSREMDANRYDSAYSILSEAFIQSSTNFTTLDRYYIHSLLSENLYYNALFEQGLAEAMQGKTLALELKNDTLQANSLNMLGLLNLNLGKYEEALGNFRSGLSKFPAKHENDFLAHRYHLLANMGECFVKMFLPDSVLFYSEWSRREATAMQRNRGVAFAYLNEAQAWVMKKEWGKARTALDAGMSEVIESNHRDVVQFLIAEEMRMAQNEHNTSALYQWGQLGLKEMDSAFTTDYARLHFLQTACEMYLMVGDANKAVDMIGRESKLIRLIHMQQVHNHAAIFKDYVHKSESLLLANQMAKALKEQIFWRRITILILTLLLVVSTIAAGLYYVGVQRKRKWDAMQADIRLEQELKIAEMVGHEKKLEAIDLERNRIAADLHDDLGASLAGINIYSALAMKKGLDEQTRYKWIEKIKSMSSQMIDNMSDIVWSIYSVHDNLPSVVLRMQAYATEVLSLQNIKVEFHVDADLNTIQAKLELRHHLMMAFKEAVINISKYSEATLVDISLSCKDNVLVLQISDNGIGMPEGQVAVGNGIKNMEKRMAKLQGEFHVQTENQRGTDLIFQIPLQVVDEPNV